MSHGSDGHLDEGRLDLVPMIDCVMLLLLFFILTTHFTSEDQRLAALLPTDVGPGKTTRIIEPPPTIRIAVLPAPDGRDALIRIGGGEPIVLPRADLLQPAGAGLERAVGELHRRVAERLQPYEQAGDRTAQVPVEIHCATRLPWSCAIAVYDAVRGYELARLPRKDLPIEVQRPVAFAAPTVRGTSTDTERDEIERLSRLR